MIVNIKNRKLNIRDDVAHFLEECHVPLESEDIEHYIYAYYTTGDPDVGFVHPDIDKIFTTKTDKELSDAVNYMMIDDAKFHGGNFALK